MENKLEEKKKKLTLQRQSTTQKGPPLGILPFVRPRGTEIFQDWHWTRYYRFESAFLPPTVAEPECNARLWELQELHPKSVFGVEL